MLALFLRRDTFFSCNWFKLSAPTEYETWLGNITILFNNFLPKESGIRTQSRLKRSYIMLRWLSLKAVLKETPYSFRRSMSPNQTVKNVIHNSFRSNIEHKVKNNWGDGVEASIKVHIIKRVPKDWTLTIQYDNPIKIDAVWGARIKSRNKGR